MGTEGAASELPVSEAKSMLNGQLGARPLQLCITAAFESLHRRVVGLSVTLTTKAGAGP